MKLLLLRGKPIGRALPGELTNAGKHVCWTLERLSVAIPAGTYQIGMHLSPHFARLMPILEEVPGREDILLHWGNYPQDSEGCILLGRERDPVHGFVLHSRLAFDHLFPEIQEALQNGEGCSISIFDPQPPEATA